MGKELSVLSSPVDGVLESSELKWATSPLPRLAALEVEVGGTVPLPRETSALPSKESWDRWAVYLTRNP